MTDVAAVVADNIDIWTSATQRKSGAGRGGGKRISLYGIERLRALILDLAVRGKLVPQEAGDEPASELLKKIAKSKATLIRGGVIRKPRDSDGKEFISQPFSIPTTWQWVRLDQVGAIIGGGTPSSNNAACLTDGGAGIAWLTPADLGGFIGRYIAHGARDLTDFGLRSSSATLMPAGSVLFTSRAPIGYVAVAENPIATNQGFKSVVPFITDCSLFIATALKSFAKDINENAPGTTFKEVSGKIVSAIPFPLPPLAEQRRIVAKVDELMTLCDALERQSTAAMAEHQALVEVLLATLANSTDAADLAHQWGRLESHFDSLFTTDASIEALKQTILDLAVRGKLVEQDAADEAAAVLLKRLAIKKSDVGRGRNWSNGVNPTERLAFAAPDGWSWTTIDQTANRVTVGYVGSMKDEYVEDGIPFLRSQNVRPNKFRPEGLTFISNEFHQKIIKSALAPGDVVVVRSGNVGTSCVIPPELRVANCSDLVVIQSPEAVVSEFLCFYLNSLASVHVEAGTVGVALTHFNTKSVATMPIPVPPLAEQRRIVARVDALMELCETLKARLADAVQAQRHLADAITERAAA